MPDTIVHFESQANVVGQRFWTASTSALVKGYAMCYNSNVGTATAEDTKRWSYVEEPTQDNNHAFAGVLLHSYDAAAGGQEVELAVPGTQALCYVADASVTQGDFLSFYVGNGATVGAGQGTNGNAGQLSTVGYQGRGTVQVLQTLSAAGLAQCYIMDGPESGMCEQLNPAVGGAAVTIMKGGYTYVEGGTVNTAHCTFTMLGSQYKGQKKGINITETIGNSKNLVVTLPAGALQLDKSATLATLTFNTAAEVAELLGVNDTWQTQYLLGATEG